MEPHGGSLGRVRCQTGRVCSKLLHLANALVDQTVGLEETDDGIWAIYFNTVLIATLDERDSIFRG